MRLPERYAGVPLYGTFPLVFAVSATVPFLSAAAVAVLTTGGPWWIVGPGLVVVAVLWVAMVRQWRIDQRESGERARAEAEARELRLAQCACPVCTGREMPK